MILKANDFKDRLRGWPSNKGEFRYSGDISALECYI